MKPIVIAACVLVALGTPAQGSASTELRLLDEATVSGNQVLLSDLLPTDASAELKSAAQTIVLGRAPEPGSFRVFSDNDVKRLLPLHTELGVPASIIVRRKGWPLNIESVREAVEQSPSPPEINWTTARIDGSTDFTTLSPEPKLEFLRARPDISGNGLTVALRCRERALCSSFTVQVTLDQAQPNVAHNRSYRSGNFAPAKQDFSNRGPDLVRPGKLALLVIDDAGLRITEPVMPKKRAGLGDIVSVSDPLTHRNMLAQVTASGKLRPASSTDRRETRP